MATVVTVKCPLCGKPIEISEYNMLTRSDALVGHIAAQHVGKIMPPLPSEGPPLPKALNIRWPWSK